MMPSDFLGVVESARYGGGWQSNLPTSAHRRNAGLPTGGILSKANVNKFSPGLNPEIVEYSGRDKLVCVSDGWDDEDSFKLSNRYFWHRECFPALVGREVGRLLDDPRGRETMSSEIGRDREWVSERSLLPDAGSCASQAVTASCHAANKAPTQKQINLTFQPIRAGLTHSGGGK